MNITHITELKHWADILTETSHKYQKLVRIVRYSNICERLLYVVREAGAYWQKRGKRDIERARKNSNAFCLFLSFLPLLFLLHMMSNLSSDGLFFLSPQSIYQPNEEANVK